MSRSENQKSKSAIESLLEIEQHWQTPLPRGFRSLHCHFTHPFLAPCEFFALESILGGAGRSYGMLPQFLPFGRAVGEGGLYGFYVTPETMQGNWPVLYWDEDEMCLRPVSSDFDAFLRHCVLVGRYETEEQWPEEVRDPAEEAGRRELARMLGLPQELLTGPVPRNETELYTRLKESDPQDAVSLCHIGCVRRAQGNSERALDYFHRAAEAAPWFGDSCYLVADVYRVRGNFERAVQNWWNVVQRLLPFCTRTWEWNLGEDHPEADIYEVAADALTQYTEFAEATTKSQPLWKVIVHDDPYDPEARETLAKALLAQNNFVAAEREYLNALSLCFAERGPQPDRLYHSLHALYERMGRPRDASFVRFDRALPHPNM